MVDERAIETWPRIAEMFNVHPRTMMRRKKELQSMGIIFYRKRRPGEKPVVMAFPSLLKLWMQRKSMAGKNF
jgi:hypothetical protein